MDKRVFMTTLALIGFFLAVSYLYPVFFPPPPKPVVQTPAATSSQGQLTPLTQAAGGESAWNEEVGVSGEDLLITDPAVPTGPTDPNDPAASAPRVSEPIRQITVQTPEYTAVFSESGGRLLSLTLKKYLAAKVTSEDPDEPQQLVSQALDQPGQSLALRLISDGSDYVDLARLRLSANQGDITVEPGGVATLVMTGQTARGLTVEKTFIFTAGSYLLGQRVSLKNTSSGAYGGRLGLSLPVGPFGGGRVGRYDSVAGFLGGKVFTTTAQKAGSKLPAEGELTRADWLGYMNQYFLSAVVLSGGQDNAQGPSVLRLQSFDKSSDQAQLVISYPLRLEPNGQANYDFNLYYGPKQTSDLAQAGNNLGRSIDLGWFWFLANPLAWLLRKFYSIVGNYGVAIIIVTILIKIALWPLTAKSYKSMKQMQKIQPLLTALREKHKDDREAMNREMMQLYKTFKINPLGGCLPMLLQIPFFIAFYRVLDYALELRGAPFMLWIQDLSAPDRLFNFGVKIPFLEPPTGIPVLT
ncbi:MAG: membrane protein insertase YidC, partial [Deltaproteobacteria bacterium]|nr:membrane protein insertase YidC [Deltaproteobacteria bacterium]